MKRNFAPQGQHYCKPSAIEKRGHLVLQQQSFKVLLEGAMSIGRSVFWIPAMIHEVGYLNQLINSSSEVLSCFLINYSHSLNFFESTFTRPVSSSTMHSIAHCCLNEHRIISPHRVGINLYQHIVEPCGWPKPSLKKSHYTNFFNLLITIMPYLPSLHELHLKCF